MSKRLVGLLATLFFGAPATLASADDTQALWEALRDRSAFALMRHALAPGTGDPEGFDVTDCSTQRNLSEAGRQQAIAIGARFRKNAITRAQLFSSAWCRCKDTAVRLGIGPVETLPALNSFFQRPARRGPQTEALSAWLAQYRAEAPLVLVTHQVNISALTGTRTTSGELVVVRRKRDGTFTVLGKL